MNENPACEVNDETVCEGEDAIFTASAGTGYTYSWSTGATTQSITVMDVSLGDDGNQYCVTITDANGCSSTCCGTLTVIEAPECAISISDSDDCGGTAVTLEVSDEFDAEWSTGAMTNSITVGAGTYCVTITDANGCTDECCYTVEEECGTSWAREINGASTCFDDLGSYCNNAVQLQWGWTTEIQRGTDVQNVYEFEILEGAPGWCQGSGSLGDVVGHATVSWGPDNGGVPIVNIDLDDGEHYTDVVHIYMGCDPLPKKGPNCTAAPGQLGCTYQYDNETSILITDLDACWDMDSQCDDPGDYAWIAIHTVTCDLVCAPDLPALAVESELFDPQESQFEFWGEVSAYPVPANDELTIEFTAPQRGDVSIELINLIGQQVNKVYRSDTDAGYHHIVKLDIHDLPPGVYMYILRNNALMYSNKIIISGQ